MNRSKPLQAKPAQPFSTVPTLIGKLFTNLLSDPCQELFSKSVILVTYLKSAAALFLIKGLEHAGRNGDVHDDLGYVSDLSQPGNLLDLLRNNNRIARLDRPDILAEIRHFPAIPGGTPVEQPAFRLPRRTVHLENKDIPLIGVPGESTGHVDIVFIIHSA
jgi:hypothetical protein